MLPTGKSQYSKCHFVSAASFELRKNKSTI
jgi:hypothetical protein